VDRRSKQELRDPDLLSPAFKSVYSSWISEISAGAHNKNAVSDMRPQRAIVRSRFLTEPVVLKPTAGGPLSSRRVGQLDVVAQHHHCRSILRYTYDTPVGYHGANPAPSGVGCSVAIKRIWYDTSSVSLTPPSPCVGKTRHSGGRPRRNYASVDHHPSARSPRHTPRRSRRRQRRCACADPIHAA
jgi:hypothetical protein